MPATHFLSFEFGAPVERGWFPHYLYGKLCIDANGARLVPQTTRAYPLPAEALRKYTNLACIARNRACPFSVYVTFYVEEARVILVAYDLWVDEEAFVACMETEGTFPHEREVVQLAACSARYFTPCLSPCRDPFPPVPLGQFIRAREQGKVTESVSVEHTRVGSTPYVYADRVNAIVKETQHNQPAMESVECRGGVVFAGPGCGKTKDFIEALTQSPPHVITPAYPSTYLTTRASLVVVSANLQQFWSEQVDLGLPKHARDRTLFIFNEEDYDWLEADTVAEASLVITTYEFLRSLYYSDRVQSFTKNNTLSVRAATRAARTVTHGHEGAFPFQSVWWARVVYDDVRNMVTGPMISPSISAGVTWMLQTHTGSSHQGYLHHDMMHEVLRAVGVCPALTTPDSHRAISDMCVYSAPPLLPHAAVTLVELSDAEQRQVKTYASAPAETCVKLCTCFDLVPVRFASYASSKNCIQEQELEEILEKVRCTKRREIADLNRRIAHQQRTVAKIDKMIAYNERRVKEINALLRQSSSQSDDERFRDVSRTLSKVRTSLGDDLRRREKFQSSIETTEALQESVTKSLAYFSVQVENYKPVVCPICMEEPTNIVTDCGHFFCRVCVDTMIHNAGESEHSEHSTISCAMCKRKLGVDNLIQIKASTVPQTREEIVRAYGTKVATLLDFCRDAAAKSQKTVVYVQWSNMARRVKTLLLQYGIRAGCIVNHTPGNSRRASCLQKFLKHTLDVVVCVTTQMTMGFTASVVGPIHNVIFLHMLVGSRDLVYDLHAEAMRCAMGASAQVRWFIAKNTPEQCSYENFTSDKRYHRSLLVTDRTADDDCDDDEFN